MNTTSSQPIVTGTLRLAFARLSQETHSFSPLATELGDFHTLHYAEGEDVMTHCDPKEYEVGRHYRNIELSGFVEALRRDGDAQPVPLMSTWCVPAGPIRSEAFQTLLQTLLTRLEAAGDVDGVYLCLHGAMAVEGLEHPECVILEAVRARIGDRPLVVSLDLHGNLTPELLALPDVICTYATNPHRDQKQTGNRAARQLLALVRGAVKPEHQFVKLPMIFGGGTTLDFLSPMRKVFRKAAWMRKQRGIWEVGVYMAHPFLDAPDVGWSVLVSAEPNHPHAAAWAQELAQACWDTRTVLPPETTPLANLASIVRKATWARRFGTVMAVDTGDCIGAGATGESTWILSHMLAEAPDLTTYLSVRDARAFKELEGTQPGQRIQLDVGGVFDASVHPPVTLDGVFERWGHHVHYQTFGLVRCGGVHVVITKDPWPIYSPVFFEMMGLSLWKADLIVVKNFFPFRIKFLPYNRKSLLVKTPGITHWDLKALPYQQIQRPVYPLDEDVEWSP